MKETKNNHLIQDNRDKVCLYAGILDERYGLKKLVESFIKAGVEDDIHLECQNFLDMERNEEYGALITNPPYGDRLLDEEAVERLYGLLGDICRMRIPKWSYYVITSHKGFEKAFGKKATKNRKLY